MSGKKARFREEDLRELLVGKGLRVTEQRLVILRELAKLRMPTSHPELTERLASTSLDRATIYRNLLSMSEVGLLIKTHLGDSVWRFELLQSSSTAHTLHPHFVCNDCGTIECLPVGSVALGAQTKHNQVVEVQLRGKCAGCFGA